MTLSPDEEAKKLDAIQRGLERLNQLGQKVIKVKGPVYHERDEAAERILDHWVGMYARNIALQYQKILKSPHIGRIRSVFAGGCPVAIVGAGPSLDKNAEHLRGFPGIIFATDRAAIPLAARGIHPDLVITVDPKPQVIASMLQYAENREQVLAVSVVSDPDVSRVWKGLKLYMSGLHFGTQFFDHLLPHLFPGMPGLHQVGNVGNSAVHMAAWVGASPIVLVGMDYGYTGGRMHAASWSRKGKGWREVVSDHAGALERRTGKVVVDGVTTYGPYVGYRDTLYRLREAGKLDIVNATEGGILNGLPCEPLRRVVKRLSRVYARKASGLRKRFRRACEGRLT
jgi:hypothetical protein